MSSEPPVMAPPWGNTAPTCSPPSFGTLASSQAPVDRVRVVSMSRDGRNTPPSSTAVLPRRRPWRAHRRDYAAVVDHPRTHLHRQISNQRSRLRTPSLLSGRSTADRRPGLPRQVSASTASWCTEPITSCHVVAQSATTSQPAVKATDVLQKSPPIFVESTRSPI